MIEHVYCDQEAFDCLTQIGFPANEGVPTTAQAIAYLREHGHFLCGDCVDLPWKQHTEYRVQCIIGGKLVCGDWTPDYDKAENDCIKAACKRIIEIELELEKI